MRGIKKKIKNNFGGIQLRAQKGGMIAELFRKSRNAGRYMKSCSDFINKIAQKDLPLEETCCRHNIRNPFFLSNRHDMDAVTHFFVNNPVYHPPGNFNALFKGPSFRC